MEPVDELRTGVGHGDTTATQKASHAVEVIQFASLTNKVALNDALAARTFGSHFPLRLHRERVRSIPCVCGICFYDSVSCPFFGRCSPPSSLFTPNTLRFFYFLFLFISFFQTALAQIRRGAGLPSSLIALETSLGLRHDINWSDVLNTPEKSEKIVNVHELMERRQDAPDVDLYLKR